MFFENNNDYLNYNLDIFYDDTTYSNTNNSNNSNIQISENYLRYNKYVYFIDMTERNNTNSNTDTNNIPNFDKEFKNLANAGITMVDTFIKSVAPVAKTFSEKMTEIDDILKNPSQSNNSEKKEKDKPLPYFKHEDSNFYYYVLDFPRANKDSCRIDINNNIITVIAETEHPPLNFEFLPGNKYEINLQVDFPVNKNTITANYLNGSLYITISKINNSSNNININILD